MSNLDFLLQTLIAQGITDPRVLAAIKAIPREKFIPEKFENWAYDNIPLPIEKKQTISQPYIVALMTQSLLKDPFPHRILEIGTGSGYQTAILATLFEEIWTIERIELLHKQAKKTLRAMHFNNIHFKWGDGSKGWLSNAPFDAIIVTAAAATLPKDLLDQLSPRHGRLVIPLGPQNEVQKLTLIEKNAEHITSFVLENVNFVPMIANKQRSSLE